MKHKRHTTMQLSGLHLRQEEDGSKSRTIEGHAVVFGQRSVNLTPWSRHREVYEVIEPGSITPKLLRSSDVVLTAFHNNACILGRSTGGRGTLSLHLDDRGLLCRCTLAETARADELLAAIERGDITGMSFAFECDEEDSENGVSYERTEPAEEGREAWIRHVKRITALYDVTIAGHPAYPQTDIELRDAERQLMEEHPGLARAEEREHERIRRQQDEAVAREMQRRARLLRTISTREHNQ